MVATPFRRPSTRSPAVAHYHRCPVRDKTSVARREFSVPAEDDDAVRCRASIEREDAMLKMTVRTALLLTMCALMTAAAAPPARKTSAGVAFFAGKLEFSITDDLVHLTAR